MPRIDLNCDMGESFGAWTLGNDEAVLAYVSSANIACGYHAGDPRTMRRTVASALARGVAVGAHPGFPDLAGFGRRPMSLSQDEVYEAVLYQIGALAGFARAAGGRLRFVKPHGALYNMAARDRALAAAIVAAVADFDHTLAFYGLAGSEMLHAAEAAGLTAVSEVFADRAYLDDGSLAPRGQAGALIEDHQQSVAQALSMVLDGKVRALSGREVPVRADTLCIHGDKPDALALARCLRDALAEAGVQVAAAES